MKKKSNHLHEINQEKKERMKPERFSESFFQERDLFLYLVLVGYALIYHSPGSTNRNRSVPHRERGETNRLRWL